MRELIRMDFPGCIWKGLSSVESWALFPDYAIRLGNSYQKRDMFVEMLVDEVSLTICDENGMMCSVVMHPRAAHWTAVLDAGAH